MQYRVPKELSTWIQRAGRAARDPNLSAHAVLLAEPSYFDDEKEASAQRAAVRAGKKRAAEGQLQPSTSKSSRRGNMTSAQTGRSTVKIDTEQFQVTESELRCEKVMDFFINAEGREERCRRRVINNHFGNNNVRKLSDPLSHLACYSHPISA